VKPAAQLAAAVSQAALLLAGNTSVSSAAPMARAELFAKLPDWRGLWQTQAAAAAVSGAGAKAAAEGAAALPPSFKSCRPVGFPTIMNIPLADFMFELLETPEQTVLVSTDGTVRHIYTDGRSHPKAPDLWPTPVGDSIGHWEGAVLVVDTIAREPGPIAPVPGSPILSAAGHFTERLQRLDVDTLEDEMTIDDPQVLTQPLHSTIRYTRVHDLDRLIPINCERDRNTVGDHLGIAPPR
jgi:hypothetical protein